jgi:hypothetical protein
MEELRQEYIERRKNDAAVQWIQVDCFIEAMDDIMPGSSKTIKEHLLETIGEKIADIGIDKIKDFIKAFMRDAFIKAITEANSIKE